MPTTTTSTTTSTSTTTTTLGEVGGNLYDLLPLLTIEAGGADQKFLKEALRLAGREFCRETEMWREIVSFLTVVDVANYTISTPLQTAWAKTDLYRVYYVEQEDIALDSTDYTLSVAGVLTFDPAPGATGDTVEAYCIVLPRRGCSNYPTWLLEQWTEGIIAGALWRLFSAKNRPWSDPDMAQQKYEEYRRIVGMAKAMMLAGRKTGNLKVQGRDFV